MGTIQITPDTKGNPVYEYIKKEDIEAAFDDALAKHIPAVLERLNEIAEIFASSTPESLWTWGYTSRWGFDKWY